MDDIVTRLQRTKSMQHADIETLCDEAANEIKRLRALITEWVDAWDEGGVDAVRDGRIHQITVRRVDAGHALRKEVRRG